MMRVTTTTTAKRKKMQQQRVKSWNSLYGACP